MTNQELNQLSIAELKELNSKVVAIIRLKQQVESTLNADNLSVGMIVGTKSSNEKLANSKFIIEKINKKNAVCQDVNTKTLWNLILCNLYEIKEVA